MSFENAVQELRIKRHELAEQLGVVDRALGVPLVAELAEVNKAIATSSRATLTCGQCGLDGHNKRTCKAVPIPPPAASPPPPPAKPPAKVSPKLDRMATIRAGVRERAAFKRATKVEDGDEDDSEDD